MTTIVGLTGKKGAGKDTFATALVEQYGFVRLAFADALYKEVCEAFNTEKSILSNRQTKETDLPELALKHCNNRSFVYIALEHLAEPGEAFNDAIERPRSPRVIMQLWGTEFRRKTIKESYWRDKVTDAITWSAPGTRFVITDVRFKDEAHTVKQLGGKVVRVLRPDLAMSAEASTTAAHSSEVDMDDYIADQEFTNLEGQVGQLYEEAMVYVAGLLAPEVVV